jgi:preprotein translocase subunit YajC
MSRRVATPINVPSNAPKRARVSSNIAGSSSTVVPSSSSLFPAPVPAPAPIPFSVPAVAPLATFGNHTGAEAIGAASSFTPKMIAAQMQFFAQMWQQQQQQQHQQHPVQQLQQGQQYVSVAEINKIRKQCSVSLKLK